jgi:hypothetical protein
MTPTKGPETLERFALEGPFSVSHLVLIGVAMAALIIFFAWRDYKSSGSSKLFAFLLLPRLVALIAALWMLAGPSMVTMVREFKPRSVVFLVDASASMGMVDVVDGSGSTLHWCAAEGKTVPAIDTLDRVIGSLRCAQMEVNRLRQIGDSPDSGTLVQEAWDSIRRKINSAAEELAGLKLDASRTDSESAAELTRAAAFLKESATVQDIQPASSGRQTREDRLDEISAFIEGGIRRVEHLSQKLAVRYEQTPLRGEQSDLTAQSKLARKDKVSAWLGAAEKSWLKDLETNAQVLRYEFAQNVVPVPAGDWGKELSARTNQDTGITDLNAALNQAAQDAGKQSVEAVVLITDGGHNATGDPREVATALRGVPTFIVPIGSLETPRDVILHHTQAPRAAFKNDNVVVEAMVTAYACDGEHLQVELLSDDAVIDKQNLTVSSKVFDARVNFQWKAAQYGRHVLKVRVPPVPREHSIDNNEEKTEIDVLEDTMRVLIADDLPRWEFRYLANLFKRDKHVDFDQLLFEPNDDSATVAPPSFPRDIDGWRKYRVVILGDVTPNQLPPAQQELLRKYVTEEGGNLIVIAGETAMPFAFADQPLGAMIPASAARTDPSQGLNLVVTAEGSASVPTQLEDDPLASERIWRGMSEKLPIYNLSQVSHPKPTCHVLIAAASSEASAEQRAFLSWQYVGSGKVIYLAAPISYELRYQKGDLYHHRFWGQLLRWAMARDISSGSKNVHLVTDKNRYEVGEHAQIDLRLTESDGRAVTGARCSVEAIKDSRQVSQIELREEPGSPGEYRGTLGDLPVGPMTLRAAGAKVQSLLASEGHKDPVEQLINVDPKATAELSNPLCNLPLLNQIADASGGAVVSPASVETALSRLNLAPETQDTVLSRKTVWDRWSLLWIIVGCLAIEWLARKYWRMV